MLQKTVKSGEPTPRTKELDSGSNAEALQKAQRGREMLASLDKAIAQAQEQPQKQARARSCGCG